MTQESPAESILKMIVTKLSVEDFKKLKRIYEARQLEEEKEERAE